MITELFLAVIYIIILCVLGGAVLALLAYYKITVSPALVIVFKAGIAILCLLLLAEVVTSGAFGIDLPGLHHRLN
jgi:hypothetical protein